MIGINVMHRVLGEKRLTDYECSVMDVEKLKLPKVYRAHAKCGDMDMDIEMHEDLMVLNKDDEITVSVTGDKEYCLEGEFCGKGYVVSTTQLDDTYRVVISIGGLLLVLKNLSKPPELGVMEEIYVRISRR